MSEWAKHLGVSAQLLSNRIDRYGWSVERALTEAPKKVVRGAKLGRGFITMEYIEKNRSIQELSRETGIPKSTIHREIKTLGISK